MEIRRALSIFHLGGRVPMNRLNGAFRELVKKYHPDKLLEYPEWAHERMAEINDAYETLASWVSRPEERSEANTQNDTNVDESETYAGSPEPEMGTPVRIRDIPPMRATVQKAFYQGFNLFLDGLGVYYQYGLENPAYRNEGTRRFRLRESLRVTGRGRDELSNLLERQGHPVIDAAYRFARYSIADIELGFLPTADEPTMKKIDNRFRAARRMFDNSVKEIFFPDMIPRHTRGRSSAGLYSSYTIFALYLAIVSEGERRNAGITVTSRYDALMDLIELRAEQLVRF